MGSLLRVSLPLRVRTALLRKVASKQLVITSHQLSSFILLYLAADVRHISLSAFKSDKRYIHLEEEESDILRNELGGNFQFSMEVLELDGVSLEESLFVELLQRSPHLHSVRVSGANCLHILQYLKIHPIPLRSLFLDNCTVTDEDVVKGILGYDTDLEDDLTCPERDTGHSKNIKYPSDSLVSLTVLSPFLTVFGAMALLHHLKNLGHLQYNSWNTSAGDSLPLLQQFIPVNSTFSLNSMSLFRPKEEDITSLREMCPGLSKLMIECYDPVLKSLELLSQFENLSVLHMRLITEELILSSVSALGHRLLELHIEFDEFTYQPLASDTLHGITKSCPNLQKFLMRNFSIEVSGRKCLPSSSSIRFPALMHLTFSHARLHPQILEQLLKGNNVLQSLTLSVNQDALTDQVLESLCKNNDFRSLTSVSFGAGMLSSAAITLLVSLPALRSLSIVLANFPNISDATFSRLKKVFIKRNYLCMLKNVAEIDL
ncbi:uncharacterized protein LOC135205476 isoform X2 [Macrobrachium nipponense]